MSKTTAIQDSLWPDDQSTDPKVVLESYNKAAPTYEQGILKDGWMATFDMVNSELDKQLPKISGPLLLLDVGCGSGMLPDKIDFSPYDVSLYGIDGSIEMITRAKEKKKYKHLEITNLAERLPFPDQMFELLVANGVLGYLEDHKPIYEFMRVMKSGGHFIFTMRLNHYNKHGWAKEIDDMSEKWTIVRKEFFDPFPNNPEYKHTYQLACIMKR